MFNLFGKKEKKQVNTQEQTIKTMSDLTQKIEEMEEKINLIEIKKRNLNEQAKTKLKTGDKTGARQALAKKKKYDEQIKQFDGAMMLMEEQKMMLENAEIMKGVFESIKNANSQIKTASEGINIEDLYKIKDEMADIADNQREINNIFAEYSAAEDPEVEDEMDKLANEINEEGKLPDVKKKADVKEKDKIKEKDELNNYLEA